MKGKTVKVKPFVTLDIEYLNAIVEDRQIIAHAGVKIDDIAILSIRWWKRA